MWHLQLPIFGLILVLISLLELVLILEGSTAKDGVAQLKIESDTIEF
jgi:hypothetical protein